MLGIGLFRNLPAIQTCVYYYLSSGIPLLDIDAWSSYPDITRIHSSMVEFGIRAGT